MDKRISFGMLEVVCSECKKRLKKLNLDCGDCAIPELEISLQIEEAEKNINNRR